MSELISLSPSFPVDLTDAALYQLCKVLNECSADMKIRVACKGGGCSGLMYDLSFDDEKSDDDLEKTWNEARPDGLTYKPTMVVDPHSEPYLRGLTIDYVENPLGQTGFKFIGGAEVKRTCGCGKSFSVG